MMEQCGNCRFWAPRSDHTADMGGGYCRRYPPSYPSGQRAWPAGREDLCFDIEPSSKFLNDAWPNVHQQSWCGEYSSARKP
jgi:hypothetical protein